MRELWLLKNRAFNGWKYPVPRSAILRIKKYFKKGGVNSSAGPSTLRESGIYVALSWGSASPLLTLSLSRLPLGLILREVFRLFFLPSWTLSHFLKSKNGRLKKFDREVVDIDRRKRGSVFFEWSTMPLANQDQSMLAARLISDDK